MLSQVIEVWTTPCYINANNDMPVRLHSTGPPMVKYTPDPA